MEKGISAFLLVLVVLYCVASQCTASGIELRVLPVGQGDCAFVTCPNSQVFIFDCGSRAEKMTTEDLVKEVSDLLPKTKVMVISHSDIDHFSYLPDLYNQTKAQGGAVQRVILSGTVSDYHSKTVRTWLTETLSNDNIQPETISGGKGCIDNCTLDSGKGLNLCGDDTVHFSLMAANVGTTSANQKSIVMQVKYNQWSTLFTGDIEGKAARQIAEKLGNRMQSTIYRVSHHGASSLANKMSFLEKIDPQYALVSNALNSPYGHPRCDVLTNLIDLTPNRLRNVSTHDVCCGISNTEKQKKTLNKAIYSTAPNAACWRCVLQIQTVNGELNPVTEKCLASLPGECSTSVGTSQDGNGSEVTKDSNNGVYYPCTFDRDNDNL